MGQHEDASFEARKLGHRLAIYTSCGKWDEAADALDQGADASVKKSQPLTDAARAGRLDIVKKCLKNGADPNDGDACALRIAAIEGHLEIVRALIEAGADIHTWNNATLRRAVEKNHSHVVDYLLDKGADIDTRDGYVFETASRFSHRETQAVLEKWRAQKEYDMAEGQRQVAALKIVRRTRVSLKRKRG